jgi:hypothetical protein
MSNRQTYFHSLPPPQTKKTTIFVANRICQPKNKNVNVFPNCQIRNKTKETTFGSLYIFREDLRIARQARDDTISQYTLNKNKKSKCKDKLKRKLEISVEF